VTLLNFNPRKGCSKASSGVNLLLGSNVNPLSIKSLNCSSSFQSSCGFTSFNADFKSSTGTVGTEVRTWYSYLCYIRVTCFVTGSNFCIKNIPCSLKCFPTNCPFLNNLFANLPFTLIINLSMSLLVLPGNKTLPV